MPRRSCLPRPETLVRLAAAVALAGPSVLGAQVAPLDSARADSARAARRLPSVTVRDRARGGSVRAAPDVGGPALGGVMLTAGAKSEIVQVAGSTGNLAEKTGRQLFAQVPGVFVYDMDGGGNQLNVATRGLDPHRSWEINVRQDGVLVNSDLYGYPASHYSPALEGVERVALVRGTAALQYGAQFGGVLDYVTRVPDSTRAASWESRSSAGSYGLLSTWHAVGGTVGRLGYLVSGSARRSDGYRRDAASDYDAELGRVTYRMSPTLGLRAQLGRSAYTHQIPGPLTDSMFAADPRASTRSRNFFRPVIWVPSLTATWEPAPTTRLVAQTSALLGRRNSVQVAGFATTPDLPNPATGAWSNRQVDVDRFGSTTTELRLVHGYTIGGKPQTLAAGAVVSANRMRRQGVGRGTTGHDYDLTLTGDFARDVTFTSRAVALYAEQAVQLTPRWVVVPGLRVERGRTRMDGRLAYYDPADVPRRVRHDFPLFGLRTTYRLPAGATRPIGIEWYGGWAQAYRPQILKDLLPESAIERTDPGIRDARGWTLEGGVRGAWRALGFDVGGYEVRVDNRFGTVVRADAATGEPYVYKTNVGATRTRGLELRVDAPLATREAVSLRAFTAAALTDATYRSGSMVDGGVGGANRPLRGNDVEAVPPWIVRSGLTATGTLAGGRTWSATLLTSYTGASFADALNTVAASANGARGRVPAHTLVDLDAGMPVTSWLRVGGGVSNAFDVRYFTKRPTFYPGPGVWPSDGRALRVTVDLTR